MEIKDWITMLSVIALIAGWFTNSWLNRKKKLQERDSRICCSFHCMKYSAKNLFFNRLS